MKYFILFTVLFAALAHAEPTVTLTWVEPTQRENGAELLPEEIGGYEIKHYQPGAPEPAVIIVVRQSEPLTSYTLDVTDGEHQFEIAAYDTNGLYSNFVPVSADATAPSKPTPPGQLKSKVNRSRSDPASDCQSRINCTVD